MKAAIVLSGGAARGIAHLGVLKALQEQKVEITAISGCSAGAIVGAMFAAGYSPEHIFEIVVSTNTLRALRPAWSRVGLLNMKKAEEIYSVYLPHNSFENLKIPLTVNATDLYNGEIIYFSTGELLKPVMASCCIPGLFEPIIHNHKTLVDGGVLNNMPIEPLLNQNEFIIGSHCNPYGLSKSPKSMASLVQKALFLAINNNSQSRIKQCNLVIEPPLLKNFDPLDIRKAKEIFKVGYEFAKTLKVGEN
ncbi:patatin-like phospholipase family protein [Arcicella rigui]|uniref:Patatin-like phospholipase family protein n=1 Tax=Arcicella rigui TaxID=797020 RepID=A0ABU5QDC5_9BACT|nr:patatin-like phospholipase family protein [Arcicella rigui]MEA5140851.1 patatin-like phospholipase family protein [Arcicella rigui]